jgi:hypothetical protein
MSFPKLNEAVKAINWDEIRQTELDHKPQTDEHVTQLKEIEKQASQLLDAKTSYIGLTAKLFRMAAQDGNPLDTIEVIDMEQYGFFIEEEMDTLMEIKDLMTFATYCLQQHLLRGGKDHE